jgi:hypothetical protein
MPTTTAQALPYPGQGDPPNGPAQIEALALAVEPRLVMVFASSADRDNKLTAPASGMLCWLQSPGCYCFHDGSSWTNQPRTRVVANRGARVALASNIIGDICLEGDTGLPFIWDGSVWRGAWPSQYLTVAAAGVSGVSNETSLMTLSVPDYGCRVAVDFVAQAILNTSTPTDIFSLIVRNGTGQSAPALSGTVLTTVPWEAGMGGYTRHAPGKTGVITGTYSLQVNVGRFAGSGSGAVAAGGQSFIAATVMPSWS